MDCEVLILFSSNQTSSLATDTSSTRNRGLLDKLWNEVDVKLSCPRTSTIFIIEVVLKLKSNLKLVQNMPQNFTQSVNLLRMYLFLETSSLLSLIHI